MNQNDAFSFYAIIALAAIITLIIQYYLIKSAVTAALKNQPKQDDFVKELQHDDILTALGADAAKFRNANDIALRKYHAEKEKISREVMQFQQPEKILALKKSLRGEAFSAKTQ